MEEERSAELDISSAPLDVNFDNKMTSQSSLKSQKRVDRQRRRAERRKNRSLAQQNALSAQQQEQKQEQDNAKPQLKRRKSLPGFLGKHRHEIQTWLKHYLYMHARADDAGVQYIKDMDDSQRAKFYQEYIDIAEFLDSLKTYLDEEISSSKCK